MKHQISELTEEETNDGFVQESGTGADNEGGEEGGEPGRSEESK